MSRLLFTVEDTYSIEGRGVVLLPGLEPIGDEVFHPGDPIRIRRPDNSELNTRMRGLEFLSRRDKPCALVIVLPKDVAKDDVPVGSEVWSS